MIDNLSTERKDEGPGGTAIGECKAIKDAPVQSAPVDLNRDRFLLRMVRELAGTLEDVVGLAEASGYISVVGSAIGEAIDADFKKALPVDRLTRDQVRDVMVDLKRRIQGDFSVLEEDDEKIVLVNRVCPFGNSVQDRPSLCMMTSNVFGSIAAQNLGYARVQIKETIARRHPGCRIIVHLVPINAPEPDEREYFRIGE